MRRYYLPLTLIGFFALIQITTTAVATIYYVDSVNGNDNNSGIGTSQAWQSLYRVNTGPANDGGPYAPGDQILLKAGDVYDYQYLEPKGSGTSGSSIVINLYGGSKKPIINCHSIVKYGYSATDITSLLQSNTGYVLSAWGKVDNAPEEGEVGIHIDYATLSPTDSVLPVFNASTYQQKTSPVITTKNDTIVSAYIYFNKNESTSYFWVDDIKLVRNGNSTNLLTDPGFESFTYSPFYQINGEVYGLNPRSGTFALKLGSCVALALYDQEYWEINNLEITNSAVTNIPRDGIVIATAESGIKNHIHLNNLSIHDVYGHLPTSFTDPSYNYTAYQSNGILVSALGGWSVATKFVDVSIQGCSIWNIHGYDGISVYSNQIERTTPDPDPNDDATPFYPNEQVVIRNNFVYNVSEGINVRGSKSPLIEYNAIHSFNTLPGTFGVGILIQGCDDAKAQYNEISDGILLRTGESFDTYINGDGEAIDVAGNNVRTIVQYNYSHHNQGGFIQLDNDFGGKINTTDVIRYNISEKDEETIFNITQIGKLTGQSTKIYNNVFYIEQTPSGFPVYFVVAALGYYPKRVNFNNNIFYDNDGVGTYRHAIGNDLVDMPVNWISQWTSSVCSYNVFYIPSGTHPSNEPTGSNNQTYNPLLTAAGAGTFGINNTDGYKILTTSPAKNTGLSMGNSTANGGKDYFGNTIYNSTADRGASEYRATSTWTTVNFESAATGSLTGVYPTTSGITWNAGWAVVDGGPTYTKHLIIDDSAATATKTFVMPTGKVLRRIDIISASPDTIVEISSSSASNKKIILSNFDSFASYRTAGTAWTITGGTVTITVTCMDPGGASNVLFDKLMY